MSFWHHYYEGDDEPAPVRPLRPGPYVHPEEARATKMARWATGKFQKREAKRKYAEQERQRWFDDGGR